VVEASHSPNLSFGMLCGEAGGNKTSSLHNSTALPCTAESEDSIHPGPLQTDTMSQEASKDLTGGFCSSQHIAPHHW